MADFSERALETLREQIRATMSAKRFAHTQGVEQTVAEMAALYCPCKKGMLRAAALLHDCTKEYTEAQTREVLKRARVQLRSDEEESPQIWHAITAPLEIPLSYPNFADEELLGLAAFDSGLPNRANITVSCEKYGIALEKDRKGR